MRLAALILIMTLVSATAFATSQKNRTAALVATVPPASDLQVQNDDTKPIPAGVLGNYLDDCKYHIPERFTPKAREYYCTCNAVALKGYFTMGEFKELQSLPNRVITNKTFQKYVEIAVAPCLDVPVKEIEYNDCVSETVRDLRIGNVSGYCGCVSRKSSEQAVKFGFPEMMLTMSTYKKGYKEPTDALWNNKNYNDVKAKSYDDCLSYSIKK